MAGLWEDGRGEMVCAMTVDEALKMGMTLSDARKVAFATAKTLEGALEVAWKCMPEILKLKKYYYQHYTTLPYLMETILSGRWYLTKSASPQLNDQQELKKFGDAKLAEKTYQLSFCKGVWESAAFWGLYGKNNPFAIKVVVPADAIGGWLTKLEDQGVDAEFKDVVYASIPLAQKGGEIKKRGCHLFWEGMTCTFGENKRVKSELADQLKSARYTGWFKDVEWIHENETRFCVRDDRPAQQGIRIPVPPMLIERMSFTYSPWADDEARRQIREVIEFCLKQNQDKLLGMPDFTDKLRPMGKRFHRSTVEGALNFRDEKANRCNKARCRFGMLLDSAK